jgi:poly(A) polymerase
MNRLTVPWTDPMRHVLAELQQSPHLRRLLAFAGQNSVKLYAVGGTLRDICLGRSVQDADLASAGDVMSFARAFADHLGAAFIPLDAARGEARVVYRKRHVLDFARLKGDDIVEDLHQRDFTLNALACPLEVLLTQTEPEFIDPCRGWQDIQAQLIRMVSDRSFRDDPVRLLRAFRFAATLEFTIDTATLTSVAPAASRLSEVAGERIQSELVPLFAAPHSSPYVVTMAQLGLLDVLFPELAATRGTPPQTADCRDLFGHANLTYRAVEDLINTPASYLPAIQDIFEAYLQSQERQALIKWAALLHVIGRAGSPREAFPGCQALPELTERSARQWEQVGSRLKLSRRRLNYTKTLIAHHHRPFELATLEAQGRLTPGLAYAWCKELGEDVLGVFALAIGHAQANGEVETPVYGSLALGQTIAHVWDLYRHRILHVLKGPRLVTGDDLQGIFHLTPSPRFKTLLDALELAQVEGYIQSRAEALQWVEARLTEGTKDDTCYQNR